MDIKEKIKSIPEKPGVYFFKSKENDILYIGKAAALKKRIKSHFAKGLSTKPMSFFESVYDIDYVLTQDESTALLLEAALIKKHNPKYNVALKDDKSYPRLKLTTNEKFPRLFITRRVKPDGAQYFGPYTNAKLLRRALMFMRRIFPLRTCSEFAKRPCLNFHIGQCLAPCAGKIGEKEYDGIIFELKLFLEGEQRLLLESLGQQMDAASLEKDYEKAAKLRDRIKALSSVAKGGHAENALTPGNVPVRFYPSQQLEELRMVLNLPKIPLAIEAFDVSNISGKEAVGSMVSFTNGRPDNNSYRKFKIKTVKQIDDYSMMREIVRRRYRRVIDEKEAFPDLIIIDGGKGHLAAAKEELRRLKILNVPIISIAKGLEKIYISEDKEPILLGKFEATLLLLRRIRDEAHRFAIDYHRLLRRKAVSASELDNIEGIGPKKKAALINHYGCLDEIKMADMEDLKGLGFISEKEAKAIYNYFR